MTHEGTERAALDAAAEQPGGAEQTVRVELSVIIAAKNAGSVLARQLDALVAQHWSGTWEVIVADNGSTDDTVQVAGMYERAHPRFRLIEASKSPGCGHARNAAMELANGEAFAFCDADDVVEPGWVAAMGDALRQNPCVGGRNKFDLLNPPWLQTAFYAEPPDRLETFAGIFPFASGCNLGVRREVVDDVGGFDETLLDGEDVEFGLRMWAGGYVLSYAPGAVVQYRYRPSLRGLWRRSREYGAVGPAIARRLKEMGRQSPPRADGLKSYVWLVRRLPMLRTQQGRARWLVVAGGKAGRLVGSVRQRHLYL